MRLLFVGDLFYGSTALQRLHSVSENGFEVTALDSTYKFSTYNFFVFRIARRLGIFVDIHRVNDKIKIAVSANSFDFVWVDKALMVTPLTIRFIRKVSPEAKLIYFSPDDMMHKANQSVSLRKSFHLYDLIVTTKSFNVKELLSKGAKKVHFIGNSYDPRIHKKNLNVYSTINPYEVDISFIGSYEYDRFQSILYLARNGIKVNIFGPDWLKFENYYENVIVVPKAFWGDEYAKIINTSKINLCFLKKSMRDLQTTRSVEIPACGGFMLAERTNEHLELFEEDKEACYFSTNEELLQKVQFYLTNTKLTEQIALNGYYRTRNSDYSYQQRVKGVFDIAKNL